LTEITQSLLKPITKDFSNSINEMLKDNSLEESPGISKLKGYYQSYKKGKTELFSSILQDIVNELMNHVPSEFLTISIEEIKTEANNEKKSGSFKIRIEKSMTVFVSFNVKINGVSIPESKLRIEIKPEGIFSVEINATERKIFLNTFDGKITSSILDIPFMKLKESIILKEKECSIDFTKISNELKCFSF